LPAIHDVVVAERGDVAHVDDVAPGLLQDRLLLLEDDLRLDGNVDRAGFDGDVERTARLEKGLDIIDEQLGLLGLRTSW